MPTIDITPEPEVHWARRYASEIGVGLIILGFVVFALAIFVAVRSDTEAQNPNNKPLVTLFDGSVDVSQPWQSSGVIAKSNDVFSISAYAQGCVRWASDVTDPKAICVGPEGASWTPLDLFNRYHSKEQLDDFPLPNAHCGSLLMRIRDHIYSIGFSGSTIKVDEEGEIQFAANIRQTQLSKASGKFHVWVAIRK